ncbi:hypothetical protein WN55_00348, partial [Dufourea novaeangliae]
HHKKKSCCVKENLLNPNSGLTKSYKYTNLVQKCKPLSKTSSGAPCNDATTTNVYINPNFKPQNSFIHINPTLRKKSLVHINPKMMKNIIHSNERVGNNPINIINSKENSLQDQNSIKKSVYVNPKLMKKLSSSIQPKPMEQKDTVVQNISHPICSRLKFIKNANSLKNVNSPKKTNNSSIVLLSRRKLIRVRRNSRKSLNTSQIELHKIKKSPNSIRNAKPLSHKVVKTKAINALQQSINKTTSTVKSLVTKPKINKYRIDRTIPQTISIKEHSSVTRKKVTNKKMELITIGGIVYKSSKNQLVRKSYAIK